MSNAKAVGFYVDKPRTGAPEFVKLNINLKAEDAIATIRKYTNEAGYCRLELLKSKEKRDEKDSGFYLQVNTYGIPEPKEAPVVDESWRNSNISGTSVPYPTGSDTGADITKEDLPW